MPLTVNSNVAVANLDPLEVETLVHVRRQGPLTRNQLVDLLGHSLSKITQTINTLMARGMLESVHIGDSSGGRRPSLVTLNPHFGYVIGIYSGSTTADICVADFQGHIIESRRQPLHLRRDKPEAVMELLFSHVIELLEKHSIPHDRVLAIGIGVPAPVEKDTGAILSPANMVGWESFSVIDYARQQFPQARIRLENDANLMALGELRAGMGRDHQNFLFVKIGTGIGCGIVINGKIYRGTHGYPGHIAHVSIDPKGPVCHCGNVGCLERFASGPAIAEQAMEAAKAGYSPILLELMAERGGVLLPEDVSAAVGRGDKVANNIIIEAGHIIGKMLAALVSFMNPSLVVIGGGVSRIGPQLLISIHRTILEYCLPLSTKDLIVHQSEIEHRAGMEGAVALALDHIFVA